MSIEDSAMFPNTAGTAPAGRVCFCIGNGTGRCCMDQTSDNLQRWTTWPNTAPNTASAPIKWECPTTEHDFTVVPDKLPSRIVCRKCGVTRSIGAE